MPHIVVSENLQLSLVDVEPPLGWVQEPPRAGA